MRFESWVKLGRQALAVLLVLGLAWAAFAIARNGSSGEKAAESGDLSAAGRVEPIAGTDRGRVILSADAANRLGIQTGRVLAGSPAATPPGGSPGAALSAALVVPYSAVLYDPAGAAWVYTNPAPLTYERQTITVASIQGSQALLSAGPPAGTAVVTVGAAELYGTELGVGGDD